MLTTKIVTHIGLLCGLNLTGYNHKSTCTDYIYNCMLGSSHQLESPADKAIRCETQYLLLNKSYGNRCDKPIIKYKCPAKGGR